MKLFVQSPSKLIAKLVILGIGIAMLFSYPVGMIIGLAQVNLGWSDPANLSKSGFTDSPNMVIDSDGIYHVIWQDEFAGIVYVTGDGVDWSVPEVIALPSFNSIPTLFADLNGYIHAFWRDANSMLWHSRVRAEDFKTNSAWTTPFLIDSSSLSFDVALDVNGDIHLSYVRPGEEQGFPAGIYYRRLRNESNDWFSPSMVYFSHYLRSNEMESSNVDISTSTADEEVSVYITWDNLQRGRVYFAKSMDGGDTWSESIEVDKPDFETGTISTSDIKVSASDQHALMVWQRRDAGDNCSQYYQWSDDGGNIWSIPQQMLANSSEGCGEENQLLRSGDGQIILWTILQDQVNLLAWDRSRWSEPQVQHELSAIEDPETLSLVILGCRQPNLVDDGLAVVGCDEGDGGDIWFTNRELSGIPDWYSSPSDWSAPQELVSSQNGIDSPVLVAGSDELLHVLWSQAAGVFGDEASTSIYYMGWDGERWSQPLTIFHSPDGNASQPSAALDQDGRLVVVWSDGQSENILFSWANATLAARVSEWAEPVPLPIDQLTAISPNILVDNAGTIFVAYAVPINEGRGIYFTRSTDGGESWSSPTQVFDGVNAGWQIVDQPQLTQTSDGSLHVLWLHKALPGSNGTLGLFYSHSEDDGLSWSDAELVIDGEVNWSQITSDAQGTVYRIWQEVINNQTLIRFQRLIDDNAEWSLPESLSSFGESLRIARLVVDQAGQLHLLQIVQDLSGRLILRHWVWEEGRWVVSENSELAYAPSTDVVSMAASVSSDANLDLVYSTIATTELNDVVQNNLFFTNRSLELPAIVPAEPTSTPASVETPLPSITPTTAPENTPTVEPTNTQAVNPLSPVESTGSAGSNFNGLLMGGILAGLIVVAVIGYGLWRRRTTN